MTTKTTKQLDSVKYETPSLSVVEIVTEGVLCASGAFEYWEDGDEVVWDE